MPAHRTGEEPTREDDQLTLDVLHLDQLGQPSSAIAVMTGLTPSVVRSRVAAIRAADTANDPDAAEWWRRNHPPRKSGRPRK